MSRSPVTTRKPVRRWLPLALAVVCTAWFLCPAAEVDFIPLIEPPPTRIIRISEAALGTVVIRFTCPRSPFKGDNGRVVDYLEPTYFEVLRKGEHDRDEIAVGRVPGTLLRPPSQPLSRSRGSQRTKLMSLSSKTAQRRPR